MTERLASAQAPPAEPARDLRTGGRWTTKQRLKNAVIYRIAMVALGVCARLPRPLVAAGCRALAALACALWPAARRRIARNLARALGPGAPSPWQVFAGLGRLLDDMLALLAGGPACDGSLRLTETARQRLLDAVAEGNGVVLATAHLGPWERLGAVLVAEGIPLVTVARRSYDPRFDSLYERLRERRGLRVVYRGEPGAAKALVRALRGGNVVGFPMDLGGRGVRTIECPWPGGTLPLATGPAELALRLRTALVVVTPVPAASDDGFDISVERIPVDEYFAQGAEALTKAIGHALGTRVKALPTQWPWMHIDL